MVVEGVQALKHALRFGGEPIGIWSHQPRELLRLAQTLAPDIAPTLTTALTPAQEEDIRRACGGTLPPSPVVALFRKPRWGPTAVYRARGPHLLLVGLTHPGNLGACIRIAAAFRMASVVCLGTPSPWHTLVVRAAAGLQWAIPIAYHPKEAAPSLLPKLQPLALLAATPAAQPIAPTTPLPHNGWFAFGGERHGIPQEVARFAASTYTIPMREGVSSINVASAVAVVAYLLSQQTA